MEKRTLLITLLIIILTGGIAASAFYIAKELSHPKKETDQTTLEATGPPFSQTEKEVGTASTTVDTSDWKVYENEECGFEVKYPKNWIIQEQEINANVIFFPKSFKESYEHPFIGINIKSNPRGLNIRDFYNGVNERDLFSQSDNEYRIGKIAGKRYFRFEPYITFTGEVIVVIPLNSIFVEITDIGVQYQNGIFDTMLSTLKFTN